MLKARVFFLIFAALLVLPPAAEPRAEAWTQEHLKKQAEEGLRRWARMLSEVRALPALERRALMLAVRGLVTVEANRELVPKLSQRDAEALWALKVLTRKQAHMSRLAADLGWPDLAGYFAKEAQDGGRLIRGEISFGQYRKLVSVHAEELTVIVTPYTADEAFVAAMMEQSDRARPLAAFIVEESRLFGSGE